MKILYITANPLEYSASANMRNLAVIRGLIKNGHIVDTLSGSIDTNSAAYDSSIDTKDIRKRYWINMGKIYSKLIINKQDNEKKKKTLTTTIKLKLYKICNKFSIYDTKKKLVKKAGTIEEKYDIIISSSDPKSSHLIAHKLIKQNPNITKKWIQYWGDPFASDINNNSLVPKAIIKREEERILSLCDKVVYVSPFTLQQQGKMYKKVADKMWFVPIPYKEKYELKSNQEKKNNNIKLGYFGNYYSNDRDAKKLIQACNNSNNVNLVLCGNTDLENVSNDKIETYKRVEESKVRELQADVDVLVCLCNRSGTQIPGKVYHYSATNKPILIILDGENKDELKKYFEQFNRFILCENNEESIANTIKNLKISDFDYKDFDDFDPQVIAKKIIDE